MNRSDFVVVGAGVNGCGVAHRLAEEGCRVTVLERYRPAAMASGWTLAGVRQSGRHPAELPLAMGAVGIWRRLADELDGPVGYCQSGNLRLAFGATESEQLRDMVESQRRAGLELEHLETPDAVRALAPALSPQVLAASCCPTDGHAEPMATVAALRAAAERHGAIFRLGEEAKSIRVEAGRVVAVVTDKETLSCGGCVVVGGVFSNRLLAPLALRIPMRVNMIAVWQSEPLPGMLRQVLGTVAADVACLQQPDGRMRFSGGRRLWHGRLAGEEVPKMRPTADMLAVTLERAAAAVPALADARMARFWGGLIDETPDALPVIERTPEVEGLVVGAGFSGHGFGIAPMTAFLLRDLALGEEPRLPLDSFRRSRFKRFDGNAWPGGESGLYG